MPVDLDKTRALLASVAGFTEGPWIWAPLDGGMVSRTLLIVHDDGIPHPQNRPIIASAPDLHRELTEAVGEIERLRAHNARMVAQINALADACGNHKTGTSVLLAIPGASWEGSAIILRRLAAGEVDDG